MQELGWYAIYTVATGAVVRSIFIDINSVNQGLVTGNGEAAIYAGEEVTAISHEVVGGVLVPITITLARAKELKRLEIAVAHEAEMSNGFESSGKTYNADALGIQTLQNAINIIANPATTGSETFDIWCADLGIAGFVQSNSEVASTSGIDIAVTLTGVETGSVLIFAVQWRLDADPDSVTDGTDDLIPIGNRIYSNGQSSNVYMLNDVTSGSKTITMTFPEVCEFKWAVLAEFTGRDTDIPVYGIAQNDQDMAGTVIDGVTSGVLYNVPAGSALYGVTFDTTDDNEYNAGAGWIYDRDIDPSNVAGAAEYYNNAPAGNYAATFTQANANGAITHLIALRAAADVASMVNHTYAEAQAIIADMYTERNYALGLAATAYAAIAAAATIPDVEAITYY
jgi:hypothetical protein